MEIRQLSSAAHTAVPAKTSPPAVEPVAPPPKGGLPASQQVLSQLTPGDRAAISGLTGYHLSPTGAVTNVGGMPPWSFIMAFAASRTAAEPVEDSRSSDVTAVEHVDVTV
ncbi:hypothetical protein Daura_26755 [Dactylosporangium aurantiacum]|uniref:Uncharacterized protein n=1 Tax=Dactylosporangium aurantiacum TaxID=35754 RepID=A0A9Q9I9N7_9ACTN|nr:hypothetical protein [Dactylosporangium aurantiacum]MDG6106536.1 hypothetical protein [Dactylosporangium aurantiacum]UWZ50435.1 hypothetical protein Daura_26755 [Dactylosporangium aurantiacum]